MPPLTVDMLDAPNFIDEKNLSIPGLSKLNALQEAPQIR